MLRQAKPIVCLAAAAALFAVAAPPAAAAPRVTRLTPPSNLFTSGEAEPIVARFLPGQRFDLQATVVPDAGFVVKSVRFFVDNVAVPGSVGVVPATASSAPAGAQVATLRAYSNLVPGVHRLKAVVTQTHAQGGNRQTAAAVGNFEVVPLQNGGRPVRNVIFLIGDGMGIAHRTAARIMLTGSSQGKAQGPAGHGHVPGHRDGQDPLAQLDRHRLRRPAPPATRPATRRTTTSTASSPTTPRDNFDNPRVELMRRIPRTAPRARRSASSPPPMSSTPRRPPSPSHTQEPRRRHRHRATSSSTTARSTGLTVLMGGGRKWFLPARRRPGSARADGTDYSPPGRHRRRLGRAPRARSIQARDLIADFVRRGFHYAPTGTASTRSRPATDQAARPVRLSNMNVAMDKIDSGAARRARRRGRRLRLPRPAHARRDDRQGARGAEPESATASC